jgi:hypothetical protein
LGQSVTAWVAAHSDRIELFYLPPDAPDHNPDEFMHNDLKQGLARRRIPKDRATLKSSLHSHMQSLQHRIVRGSGDESVIQRETGLARLLVNELTAHPVPGRQIANRCRSRQHLNGQALAVTPWHRRRRRNASIHLVSPLTK